MTASAVLPFAAALLLAAAIFLGARGVDEALAGEHRRARARLDAIAGTDGHAGHGGGTSPVRRARSHRGGRLGERLRSDLRRAGLAWTITDYVAIIAIAAAVAALLTAVLTAAAPLAACAAAGGGALPWLAVRRRATARAARLNAEVVGAIELLASSLRSGFGFMQSLELAAREQPEPIAGELRQALREVDLGVSVDEALERLVARTRDDDLELVISAVLIQRRVGGDLGEVLGNIARMIRDRIRIRGEINTLTAQARLSALILGLLPIGLGALLTAMQPAQMAVLVDEPIGRLLLAGAATLEVIGFVLVRRVANITY